MSKNATLGGDDRRVDGRDGCRAPVRASMAIDPVHRLGHPCCQYFGWRIALPAAKKSCCDFNGIVGDAPGGDGATDFVRRFGIDYQW